MQTFAVMENNFYLCKWELNVIGGWGVRASWRSIYAQEGDEQRAQREGAILLQNKKKIRKIIIANIFRKVIF